MSGRQAWTEILILAAIALLAILVHGYHLGSDNAEIYVPAIKKVADPALFPFGSQFFMHHARLSFFSDLVGNSDRVTGLPVDWAIFLWHGASLFLLLLAGHRLLRVCFSSTRAHWAGVAILASVLTVPVAGTALVIMDPYLTARCLSTPATLFAVACFAGFCTTPFSMYVVSPGDMLSLAWTMVRHGAA